MLEHTCGGMCDLTCDACGVLRSTPITDAERNGDFVSVGGCEFCGGPVQDDGDNTCEECQ